MPPSNRTDHADVDLVQRVVHATAEAAGEDPRGLPPLHGSVDPDALCALVDSLPETHTPMGTVRFAYAGCEVTVTADGAITVHPA